MKANQMLVGERFGRLTPVQKAGVNSKREILWECQCDCGKTHVTTGTSLRCGHTKSCGCITSERIAELGRSRVTNHGLSKTPTGVSWGAMMQRCHNPKVKAYPAYGAVGIKPCAFIKASPVNLVLLIDYRPSTDVSLDRIQNKFGYTCGACEECIQNDWPMNVRWATRTEQSRNRQFCNRMTIDGETKTLVEWSEILGLPITTLRYRKWKEHQPTGLDYTI